MSSMRLDAARRVWGSNKLRLCTRVMEGVGLKCVDIMYGHNVKSLRILIDEWSCQER
jgi:hypothetical protein